MKKVERMVIWSGLLWIGYYWNPLKDTMEDLLWTQLWGFLLVFFICIMEELKATWEKLRKEGGWTTLYLTKAYPSWYIQKTVQTTCLLYPLLLLFWFMTGPWILHPDPDLGREVHWIQPLFLWIWSFFWIQVLFFWMVWNGRKDGDAFPLEIWILFPFAFYTFLYVCEPSLWWIDDHWNPLWKTLGCGFLFWSMISPTLFSLWFKTFLPR